MAGKDDSENRTGVDVDHYLRLEPEGGLRVNWSKLKEINNPGSYEIGRLGAHQYLAATEIGVLNERIRRLNEDRRMAWIERFGVAIPSEYTRGFEQLSAKEGNLRLDVILQRKGDLTRLVHELDCFIENAPKHCKIPPKLTREELDRIAFNIEFAQCKGGLNAQNKLEMSNMYAVDPGRWPTKLEALGIASARAEIAEMRFHDVKECWENVCHFSATKDGLPGDVQNALDQYEEVLRANSVTALDYSSEAGSIVQEQSIRLYGHYDRIVEPFFTSDQARQVVRYAEIEQDPIRKNHYLGLLEKAKVYGVDYIQGSGREAKFPEPALSTEFAHGGHDSHASGGRGDR